MACKPHETLGDTLYSSMKILCNSWHKSGIKEKLHCKTLQLCLIQGLKQAAMESIKMQRQVSGTSKDWWKIIF